MNANLPAEVLHTMTTEPLFSAVLEKYLEEEELVSNFERLFGVHRPPQRLSPLELMVDQATGFRDDQWSKFFSAFIPFVHRCVWLTWEGRLEERKS